MKDNSKCKTRIIVSIAIVVIFILIFLLQSNIPMLGYDDFILNSPRGKGVAYLIAEIESSIKYWNGRSSQIIGYLIGFCPRYIFWILNSLAIILFIYLVYYYSFSESDKKDRYKNIILTFLIVMAYIFYLFPATFDVFFWMPGACNHLWSVIITLIFLIPYYKLLYNKNVFDKKNKAVIIIYILLGLIAGASLENISIFGILLILYTFIKSLREKKILKWQVGGFISYIIGIAYLFFLSSTKKREAKFLAGTNIAQRGLEKILYIFEYFFVENKYFIFIMLILLIIFIIYLKLKKQKYNNTFKNILLLFIFSISTLLIFYFVPYYSNRALLLFSFISLVLLIYIISYLIINKKTLFIFTCLMFCIINTYAYNYFFEVYKLSNQVVSIRNEDVKKQAENEEKVIDFDFIPCLYGIRIIEYKEYINRHNSKDNNNYDNSGIKKFYNIDNNRIFDYKKNYEYNKYCKMNNPIFNIMGFSGYNVKNKYEVMGMVINDKEKNN